MAQHVHHPKEMIGVFDSGIGGLTVLEALRRQMPRRDFIYVADTARLPYGPRPASDVRRFSSEIMEFLCDLEVEGIVIACNTASAAALPELKLNFGVPVWGVVDSGVETATRTSYTGRVGVIATEGTIASGVFQRKLEARGFRVWSQACPALVQAVEDGSGDVETLVRHYLREMPRPDTLLLGCTHFVRIQEVIQRVAGPRVRVVEGSAELAKEVAEKLGNEGSGRVRYYVTGDPERFAHAAGVRSLVQQTSLAEISRGVEVVHVD